MGNGRGVVYYVFIKGSKTSSYEGHREGSVGKVDVRVYQLADQRSRSDCRRNLRSSREGGWMRRSIFLLEQRSRALNDAYTVVIPNKYTPDEIYLHQ